MTFRIDVMIFQKKFENNSKIQKLLTLCRDYHNTIESAILSCRRNLGDFAFRHGLMGCKIICPWSMLKGHAEALWAADPVHMTKEGFDLLAGLVLEAATGADDIENKKRPLDKPEARSGYSKKRLN